MKLLSSLARALVRPEFVASLRAAKSADELVGLVDGGQPGRQTDRRSRPRPKAAAAKAKSIIAITACPTGIAHTYMAADALKLAAERAGIDLTVETQGSSGSTPVGADIIANADAVIFATDVGVRDRQRFAGKPVIASGSSVRSTSPTR